MNILTLPITGAVAAQLSGLVKLNAQPRNLTVQANFTYGSGGTSVDAYLQTSVDGGATWTDVAEFNFTTASARKLYNLSAQTAKTTAVSPTDGSLTANTSVDGILGPEFRVKYTTVGTYAGGTNLAIDISSDQIA
jgi:hypothetical protein